MAKKKSRPVLKSVNDLSNLVDEVANTIQTKEAEKLNLETLRKEALAELDEKILNLSKEIEELISKDTKESMLNYFPLLEEIKSLKEERDNLSLSESEL